MSRWVWKPQGAEVDRVDPLVRGEAVVCAVYHSDAQLRVVSSLTHMWTHREGGGGAEWWRREAEGVLGVGFEGQWMWCISHLGSIRMYTQSASNDWICARSYRLGRERCVCRSCDVYARQGVLHVVLGNDMGHLLSFSIPITSSRDCTTTGDCADVVVEHVVTVRAHEGPVQCIRIHGASDVVVTGSQDRSLRVWPFPLTSTCARVLTCVGHSGRIWWCSLVPHSSPLRVLSCAQDATVRLWQLEVRKGCYRVLMVLPMSPSPHVRLCDPSPDGSHVLVHSSDHSQRILNLTQCAHRCALSVSSVSDRVLCRGSPRHQSRTRGASSALKTPLVTPVEHSSAIAPPCALLPYSSVLAVCLLRSPDTFVCAVVTDERECALLSFIGSDPICSTLLTRVGLPLRPCMLRAQGPLLYGVCVDNTAFVFHEQNGQMLKWKISSRGNCVNALMLNNVDSPLLCSTQWNGITSVWCCAIGECGDDQSTTSSTSTATTTSSTSTTDTTSLVPPLHCVLEWRNRTPVTVGAQLWISDCRLLLQYERNGLLCIWRIPTRSNGKRVFPITSLRIGHSSPVTCMWIDEEMGLIMCAHASGHVTALRLYVNGDVDVDVVDDDVDADDVDALEQHVHVEQMWNMRYTSYTIERVLLDASTCEYCSCIRCTPLDGLMSPVTFVCRSSSTSCICVEAQTGLQSLHFPVASQCAFGPLGAHSPLLYYTCSRSSTLHLLRTSRETPSAPPSTPTHTHHLRTSRETPSAPPSTPTHTHHLRTSRETPSAPPSCHRRLLRFQRLPTHSKHVNNVCAEGQWVWSVSDDGCVCVWSSQLGLIPLLRLRDRQTYSSALSVIRVEHTSHVHSNGSPLWTSCASSSCRSSTSCYAVFCGDNDHKRCWVIPHAHVARRASRARGEAPRGSGEGPRLLYKRGHTTGNIRLTCSAVNTRVLLWAFGNGTVEVNWIHTQQLQQLHVDHLQQQHEQQVFTCHSCVISMLLLSNGQQQQQRDDDDVNGQLVLTSSTDCALRLWRVRAGEEPMEVLQWSSKHAGVVMSMCELRGLPNAVACACESGHVRVVYDCDVSLQHQCVSLEAHSSAAVDVCYLRRQSPQVHWIASIGSDCRVMFWSVSRERVTCVGVVATRVMDPSSLCCSEGRWITCAGDDVQFIDAHAHVNHEDDEGKHDVNDEVVVC